MMVPVKYENPSPIPLFITEAYVEAGELMTSGGADGEGVYVPFTDQGELVRELKFTTKAINQSEYPIIQLDVAIQNPVFIPDDGMKIILYREPDQDDDEAWADRACRNYLINPQEIFSFMAPFYVKDKQDDLELMDYLPDFQLKVVGIKYEAQRDKVDSWSDDLMAEWAKRGWLSSTVYIPGGPQIDTVYVYPKNFPRKD